MSNRIRVGFHRVGIALAILPSVAAVAVVIAGGYQWGWPLVKPPAWKIEHKETGKSFGYTYGTDPKLIGKKMHEAFAPMAVPDDVVSGVDKGIVDVDRERQGGLELMTIGAALAALAVGVYAASWLLGWIARGFLGEDAT
jgi:hypothetical protein